MTDLTLEEFAAEIYQVLGALNAPKYVLDHVFSIANGRGPLVESLLPFDTVDKVYEAERILRRYPEGWTEYRQRIYHYKDQL